MSREKKNIRADNKGPAVMPQGACVFDIDETLTCGNRCSVSKVKAMHKAIDYCVEKDMAIEVNTARPGQADMLWGVPKTVKQKLVKNNADVYYRPLNSRHSVEEQKLVHMRTIAKKWHISDKKNLVLFDDRLSTCRHLQKNGISAIHVAKMDGITNKEVDALKRTLRKVARQ